MKFRKSFLLILFSFIIIFFFRSFLTSYVFILILPGRYGAIQYHINHFGSYFVCSFAVHFRRNQTFFGVLGFLFRTRTGLIFIRLQKIYGLLAVVCVTRSSLTKNGTGRPKKKKKKLDKA